MQYPLAGGGAADGAQLSSVVFAEPAEQLNGPPRPSDLLNGLLPGDQLLEVEGQSVERLKREQLLQLVQDAGPSIRLKVQVVPELAELCGRSAASREARLQLASLMPAESAADLADIPEAERFWLVHSNGYSLVRLLQELDGGRARIQVGGQEMVVDQSDLDRANPADCDRANDLAALKHLNETAALHLLRNRFGSSLQYTNAGPRSLVYLSNRSGEFNPVGGQHLIRLFKGCRRGQMPAHIYSTAQQVYRQVDWLMNDCFVSVQEPADRGQEPVGGVHGRHGLGQVGAASALCRVRLRLRGLDQEAEL